MTRPRELDPLRGRGASWNPANRFDGWEYGLDAESLPDDEAPWPRTQFIPDRTREILSHNDSPDVGFDYGLNPYRGCEHGCVYCYARPTHEYLGYSAGLDFETKILVKYDAPALLRERLSGKRWEPQPIALSGNVDAYQPVEHRLRITRQCLEVMAEFRNPVIIITKNRLVTRDLDVLGELAAHDAAAVMVSVTTLDLALNRTLEPRSSSPQQRLDTIAALHAAGIPAGVMVAPIIPGLTDHEVPAILKAAADAGATRAGYVMLRLPLAVAPLFEQWLEQHAPLKKDKILNRVRAMRDGALYKSGFGTRMRGQGVFAEQIRAMFDTAARKYGLSREPLQLSSAAFRRPDSGQLSLF